MDGQVIRGVSSSMLKGETSAVEEVRAHGLAVAGMKYLPQE